jgi:hypothetical protein
LYKRQKKKSEEEKERKRKSGKKKKEKKKIGYTGGPINWTIHLRYFASQNQKKIPPEQLREQSK